MKSFVHPLHCLEISFFDHIIIFSENIILGDDDREGFFHSFVALSAHYIGLNVTQCKYDENVSFHLIHYRW